MSAEPGGEGRRAVRVRDDRKGTHVAVLVPVDPVAIVAAHVVSEVATAVPHAVLPLTCVGLNPIAAGESAVAVLLIFFPHALDKGKGGGAGKWRPQI